MFAVASTYVWDLDLSVVDLVDDVVRVLSVHGATDRLAVPRTSLTVPSSLRAMERSRIVLAISITSSTLMLPLWATGERMNKVQGWQNINANTSAKNIL